MSSPIKGPADWSVYETNEIAPGVFQLSPEQSGRLLAETAGPACPRCGGPTYGPVCRPCDMLLPVEAREP